MSYDQSTFMILYSQTNQKLVIDIKFQGIPVTMVSHGARGERETTVAKSVYYKRLWACFSVKSLGSHRFLGLFLPRSSSYCIVCHNVLKSWN